VLCHKLLRQQGRMPALCLLHGALLHMSWLSLLQLGSSACHKYVQSTAYMQCRDPQRLPHVEKRQTHLIARLAISVCVQDPSNKRYVISDDALQKLTGESRFLAFGAQKLFGKHFPK
jgi:hypothetical protein